MGADLYIEAIQEEVRKEWKPKFDDAVERRDKLLYEAKQAEGRGHNRKAARLKEDAEAVQVEVSEAYDGMYSKGYFRDSYNSTSLFWRLGLSWWELLDEENNGKYFHNVEVEDDGEKYQEARIEPEHAKALQELVKSREVEKVSSVDELVKMNCSVEDSDDPVKEWNDCWEQKKVDFLAFLQECVDTGHYIRPSV